MALRRLFHPRTEAMSPHDMRRQALFEVVRTMVDFGAALCFVVGSIMFFSDAWLFVGTWFFLVGSVLFAVKPTLRLWQEIDYVRRGKLGPLANGDRGE